MKDGKLPGALRRKFLQDAAAMGGVAAAAAWVPSIALAQAPKIKVGLMLPYTGTFAQLGIAITNGFKLAIAENGGKLAGREIEYFTVDDESDPAKGADNANRLVNRDKVDVLVGTVHSGVAGRHGEDRTRDGRAAHHSERRPRCGHDGALRAEHLPHLVRQLADRPTRWARCSRTAASRTW